MSIRLVNRRFNILQSFSRLPELVSLSLNFRIFKEPIQALKLYLTKKNAPQYLELANGFRIHLSSHPEDIVTVAVVFCKHDYGTDFAGKTIIDIGANIGIFSLFAAYKDAQKIVAIEPGQEAISTLKKSIEANSLQQRITAIQAAVTAVDGGVLHFPTFSSPNNRPTNSGTNTIEVPTVSLKTIINSHFNNPVDLLKMDCEGGEYDILYNTDKHTLALIREIRMELHGAKQDEDALLNYLQQKGFKLNKYRHDNAWLTNTKA